jgi:hypothetical protein
MIANAPPNKEERKGYETRSGSPFSPRWRKDLEFLAEELADFETRLERLMTDYPEDPNQAFSILVDEMLANVKAHRTGQVEGNLEPNAIAPPRAPGYAGSK